MRKSRFSEELIIATLREQEQGVATAKVCRRCGNRSATFFRWRGEFDGMDVSDVRRLKVIEDENAVHQQGTTDRQQRTEAQA
jgi:putative transposase